jgi:hypothetical protein
VITENHVLEVDALHCHGFWTSSTSILHNSFSITNHGSSLCIHITYLIWNISSKSHTKKPLLISSNDLKCLPKFCCSLLPQTPSYISSCIFQVKDANLIFSYFMTTCTPTHSSSCSCDLHLSISLDFLSIFHNLLSIACDYFIQPMDVGSILPYHHS